MDLQNPPAAKRRRVLLSRIPERTKINVLLASHGLTQYQLANIIGVARQTLNAILTGRKRVGPNNGTTQSIADYFNQPVDELFPVVDLGSLPSHMSSPISGLNLSKEGDKKQP